LHVRIKVKPLRTIPLLLAFLIGLAVYNSRAPLLSISHSFECILSGKFICGKISAMDELLFYIRDEIPTDSAIFFSRTENDIEPLTIRYLALHSLTYSWKDKLMHYSNSSGLDEWFNVYERLAAEGNTTEWYMRDPQGFVEFVISLGSDFAVLEKPPFPEVLEIVPNTIVFENKAYVLFKLNTVLSPLH
jgi:hypothetical protein